MGTFLMRGIPSHMVSPMWHYAEPYVKRALDQTSGELTYEDIRRLCEDRSIQLWLVSHDNAVVAALTTEIVQYPQRKHFRVITLGGSGFADWIGLVVKTLDDFAAAHGCDAVEAHVRRGLVQKLLPHGYHHKYSTVVRELPHVQLETGTG